MIIIISSDLEDLVLDKGDCEVISRRRGKFMVASKDDEGLDKDMEEDEMVVEEEKEEDLLSSSIAMRTMDMEEDPPKGPQTHLMEDVFEDLRAPPK